MVGLLDVVSPARIDTWRELVRLDPEAGAAQTPDWLASICEVGPYRDASRLYRFDDGRRVLLPFAARRRLPVEASWPFDWGAGGPLADGPLQARQIRAVYDDLLAQRRLRLTLRPGPFADPAWDQVPTAFAIDEHTSYCVDLTGGFDRLWSGGFHGSVRRAVRKALRSGLRIEVDRTGRLIGVFDQLYRRSVARWAEQQHEPLRLAAWRAERSNPRRKFEAVARRLGDRCAVWVAWLGDEPAAAMIVLRQGTQVRYWRGAMDHRLASPTRANDLLHQQVIEDACRQGATRYHLGESRPGSGLAAFKAGFGASPYQSNSYFVERLPLTGVDAAVRSTAKRLLRFRDH